MKIIALLCVASMMISHSANAMDRWMNQVMNKWPKHFKNLSCSERSQPIDTQALLEANPFWKTVAETAKQEDKDNYLERALNLAGDWEYRRKAIACALATGSNPDIYGFENTALLKAIKDNDYHLAAYALNSGADANNDVKSRKPPLFLARSLKIAQLLIEHNANISHENYLGTVLHQAAGDDEYSTDLISYYVQQGIDVNTQNNKGYTPIMSLILDYTPRTRFIGDVVCPDEIKKIKFRLLLEHGADVTIKNKDHKTVWDIAVYTGRYDEAQEAYKQFQQECAAYSLLISRLRLFSNQS